MLKVIEAIKNDKVEFKENIKLPVTDKRSPVRVEVYELTYDDLGALTQVDVVNLARSTKKTVYPKRASNITLLKTRQSRKKLINRLTPNGYTEAQGLEFAVFWKVFKEFALNDKFDCADDSILWESQLGTCGNTVHIARQFVRESAKGEYLGIEQLNIEFEIPRGQSNTATQPIWSGNDLEEFFEEVEQSDEFNLIAPNAVIKLSIAFDKV